MAVTQGYTTSFKIELFKGLHDFSASGGDAFKLALYVDGATLGADTTAYTATDEVAGSGYTAGGVALTNIEPTSSGKTAIVDFSDVTISTVTIAPRSGLIYNSTNGNRSVAVLDFGFPQTRTAADLVITFPTADAVDAIIRFT